MTADQRHEELLSQYKRALEEHRAAQKVEAETGRAAKAAELAVLEYEGRGHTVDACWIRAWLARDFSECDRLLRLKYPEQATIERPATDEERDAFRAQAELMDCGRVVVGQVAGIPVTVDGAEDGVAGI